ncbi:RIP metalloprotease RseP [Paludifilum halophilum]|uniref:RIP metalloprotease RseP n=1 Tax=Paludifilum halophilum TaxID=1642702 RepID=UPI001F0AEC64|nr:RIP metalloprotease RseP [Paludifilum halophilum]
MQTILWFILLISLLVFIHELGHFIFAKRAGMLVREFAIGFGPKLVSWFKGETLYSIRILPLGGYVRVAGEDPEVFELKTGSHLVLDRDEEGRVVRIRAPQPSREGSTLPMEPEYGEIDDPTGSDLPGHLPPVTSSIGGKLLEADLEDQLFIRLEDENGLDTRYRIHPQALIQYDEKNISQIAPLNRQYGSKTILQRGLFIAAGPVFNFFLAVVLLAGLTLATGIGTKVTVKDTVPGSPAEKAGLKPGDTVREVEGNKVKEFNDISVPLQEARGDEVTLKVERANQLFETQIEPEKRNNQFIIGIQMEQERRKATISEASIAGFTKTYDLAVIMGRGISRLVTGQVGMESLAGPVGIADITGKAADAGWLNLVHLAALLSLNLGIINILPFPALDGGRLTFLILEALRGRPIDPNKEGVVHFVGFALLMMLMMVVTYNDIVRVFFKG